MQSDLSLLFDRPFWLDEWHAVLPASRPSLGEVIRDLRRGSDFAPPLLHVVLWLLRVITGGTLTPVVARSFAFACVAGALVLVYFTLRRRFDRTPSLSGALACATHAIVVAYAFEARFYAPWLFFAAAFAWALWIDADHARSTRRDVGIGAFAVGLCSTHWLGIVTLGLMCAGAFLAIHDRRAAIRRVLPASAGLVVFAACLPLLVGQRSSISEATWIGELSGRQLRDVLIAFWGGLPVLLSLATVAVAFLFPGTGKHLRVLLTTIRYDPPLMAMLALAMMPVVLAVISLRQPAMLPRYAIASVLAWAPLVALAVQLMLHPVARVASAALLGLGVLAQIGGQLGLQRQIRDVVIRDGQLLRDACASAPGVAFVTRVQMYYYTNELRGGCPQAAFLVIPPETLARLFVGSNASVQRQYRTEAEFARLHGRLYGFPRTITPAQLDSLPHFVVMVERWSVPRDASDGEIFSSTVFPNHRAIAMTGNGIAYLREAAPVP